MRIDHVHISIVFDHILFCIVVLFPGYNLTSRERCRMAGKILISGAIIQSTWILDKKTFFFSHLDPTFAYYVCPRCRHLVTLLDHHKQRRPQFPTPELDKEHRMLEHEVPCREACHVARKKSAKRKNHVMLFAK